MTNPTTSFGETKIVKVTPGRPRNYIKDGLTGSISLSTDRHSSYYVRQEIIPARFKMYLYQIRLSKRCLGFIKRQLKCEQFHISIKWTIFNTEDFVTSPEKVDHDKVKFDYTAKYNQDVDEDFVRKVKKTPIIFRLFAKDHDAEVFLGESQFCIPDIVHVMNVKQIQRVLFTNHEINTSGDTIAYLDLWYKFTCKQRSLKLLLPDSKIEKKTKSADKMSELLGDRFSENSKNFDAVHVTDSEFDHFADSVLLVLNRNKVLKTTQSDIDTELQERVRWMRFEANWKQTLQENAILHGNNPEDVVWRQWREEDTANVKLRTYDDIIPKTYPPKLSITIVDLFFLEGCSLLKNEDVKQFYVEYSFLGREGPEMETPFSVAKARAEERVVFNFTKTFNIDLAKNPGNCEMLAKLIKEDGFIKFVVVSEPVEDLDHPIQTCQEVGYAEVPLNELIQLQENSDLYEYEIIDINNSIVLLGFLTIKVEGILAMRKMALDFMAPKDYKLYM